MKTSSSSVCIVIVRDMISDAIGDSKAERNCREWCLHHETLELPNVTGSDKLYLLKTSVEQGRTTEKHLSDLSPAPHRADTTRALKRKANRMGTRISPFRASLDSPQGESVASGDYWDAPSSTSGDAPSASKTVGIRKRAYNSGDLHEG